MLLPLAAGNLFLGVKVEQIQLELLKKHSASKRDRAIFADSSVDKCGICRLTGKSVIGATCGSSPKSRLC
jgi:hypothetical protein